MFSSSFAFSQCEEQIKELEKEVALLKDELLAMTEELIACRQKQPLFPGNVFEGLDEHNRESKKNIDQEIEEFVKTLNRKGQKEAKKLASQIQPSIDFFEALRSKLIFEVTGIDTTKIQSQHAKDKVITGRVLLEEGGATKWKQELEKLVALFSSYNVELKELAVYKTLHPVLRDGKSLQEAGRTWEEYKFKGMPLGAVLPLMSQLIIDIKQDELTVLETLKN